MKYILFLIMIAFCTLSCNDWLDVRPETEQKDKDQFASVNGFYDALVGCYMSMANADAYGERLTISNIESLARLWYMPEKDSEVSSSRLGDWELTKHDYTGDYAKSAVQAMYSALFYVITQANMILKYAEEREDIFTNPAILSVIKGEAYALRAYCQLDVLRLFGQMPKNSVQQVSLPYSYTTSIDEMPRYYDFHSYVECLEKDLTAAENCLKDNDPVFEYTFDELNKGADVANDHLLYRQSHLNYWAVRALRARMYLYLDRTDEAFSVAREVITAVGPDGKAVMEMSGRKDFGSGYRICPNECLFYLSKYNIMTSTESFLLGGQKQARYGNNSLVITNTMRNDLYAGENTTNNRYRNLWNTAVSSSTAANAYVATKKYWWEEEKEEQALYFQLVPMLRMSEVYLIGMECSSNLSEINGWYKQYMIEHEVGDSQDFLSVDDARKWIHTEYRREFFAEGQAFYTYKRTGATTMLGSSEPVGEIQYIVQLPETEYNPNNQK